MIYTCVKRYVPKAVKAEAQAHHEENIPPTQECTHADCDCAKVWFHSHGDRQYTRLEVGCEPKVYWFHGHVSALNAVSWLHEHNLGVQYVKAHQVPQAHQG